jgi:hypothetical protein
MWVPSPSVVAVDCSLKSSPLMAFCLGLRNQIDTASRHEDMLLGVEVNEFEKDYN